MKYKITFLAIILGLSGSLLNRASAQKNIVPWQVATRDSIRELITRFGWSMDLYFLNPTDEKYVAQEKRMNETGVGMFKSLFTKYGADTSFYKNRVIVNFIDTSYIRLNNEYTEGCQGDPKCRDNVLKKLLALNNRKISVNEYLKLHRRYYNNNLSADFFPGSYGSASDSVFIDNIRLRIAANTYTVDAYTKINFSGFSDVEKEPVQFILNNMNLRFRVEFEEVKTEEGIIYRNYRIVDVTDFFDTGGDYFRQHILNIEPSVGFGFLTASGEFSNHDLDNAFKEGNAWSLEFGVLAERKMNIFRNGNTKFNMASGILLRNQVINSSILNGYSENVSKDFSKIPFQPSDFLKKYSLETSFRNVDFTDRQWFVGIPLRLGIDFGLSGSKNYRGYLKTMFACYLPVESTTSSGGTLNQRGKFTYEHIPGFETVVYMGEADNPFPDSYGLSEAYAQKAAALGTGFGNKTEFGISLKIRNSSFLNIGPWFSLGTFKVRDTVKDHLAEEGGEVKSPLNALSKFNFMSYGATLSLSFELSKSLTTSLK